MSRYDNSPVVPRNGHTLVVGIVARISGCQGQKELSLEDQQDHAVQVVADYYDGPVERRVIATRAKGERLDRPELAQIEAMLRSRELDFLVAEDIGRLVRGSDAVRLCGIAVDQGVRVLAPNDCIDTAEEHWEEDVIAACRDHVGHNSHTSKRIKQKKMNRFRKFGGATPCEIFGYIKLEGAKTYDDWRKDDAATAIYQEWFRILRATLNCSAVADWLNRTGVSPGPYNRTGRWDGATVRRITGNPLLKGMPGRGFRHTVKHHETGRRISVKNPRGPVFREYPHLVHIDAVEFDEVNALLEEANRRRGRKPVNGVDPRWRVPRKRTRFPGQHARCWYCGQLCVWGGNGMTENLMCNGSRAWHCWNSIGFHGLTLADKLCEAIAAELYGLDGFDEQFQELVNQATSKVGGEMARISAELDRGERETSRQKQNLLAAIMEYGTKPWFQAKLLELEENERSLARRRREIESRRDQTPQLPSSITELRQMLEEKLKGLARDSWEFGDLMRQIAPEIHVYLVRLCDGGHLLPRARVRLSLASIIPDAKHAPDVEALLTRELTLDLFEPPLRERIRPEAVRLAAQGLDQREIARRLSEQPTQPVVTKALALDRRMRELGLENPYVIVSEPPPDYSKLRRHQNSKYQFEPADEYQRPSL